MGKEPERTAHVGIVRIAYILLGYINAQHKTPHAGRDGTFNQRAAGVFEETIHVDTVGSIQTDLFTRKKYYSLKLTIIWDRVYSYTSFEGLHSIEAPKTVETSRESKKKECDVKWPAGGSLEIELENLRPREKWCNLSDNVGMIYMSSKSLQLLQEQVEKNIIHSVRLTLKVADVRVNTQKFISGREHVYVDGEWQPWWPFLGS